MENVIDDLISKFEFIKSLGWVKSKRQGNDAVGRTFESLLGCDDNELEIPDFNEIEIKTKRNNSLSYVSLFNMTPSGKYYHEIERLRETFGYDDPKTKQFKVLNNSVYCSKRTFIGVYYQFMLKVDRKERKIYLCIFDISGSLIEKDIYWDFDIIEEKLYRKLKYLAFIKADCKFKNNIEHFYYRDINLFVLKDFDTFICLIEKGIIRITFKIGVFKSGRRIGQTHDHGTSFNIRECDLLKLYNKYYL